MLILGIETSCDETSIAILDIRNKKIRILSNIVSSQVKIHTPYGGVVPNLAAREHQKNLVSILRASLKESRLGISKSKFPTSRQIQNPKSKILNSILEREPELLRQFKRYIAPLATPKIDLIAVTAGPGLEPTLWVGINFAKALSFLWQKSLIGVSHLAGHVYSNWLKPIGIYSNLKPRFPILNLIVSGGHTMLVLMTAHGKYKILGETLDDAAGEAFDKVARMLGLEYPGGPIISKIAEGGNPNAYSLPRPMLNQKNYNFSFSGLKTAVLYLLKDLGGMTHSRARNFKVAGAGVDKKTKQDIAASFQKAVMDVLVTKTLRAAKEYGIKTVYLSGGVSANKFLRQALERNIKKHLPGIFYSQPLLEYTGDNAAMIALAGYFNIHQLADKKPASKIKNAARIRADANLKL